MPKQYFFIDSGVSDLYNHREKMRRQGRSSIEEFHSQVKRHDPNLERISRMNRSFFNKLNKKTAD
ncbi:hypothetical protein C0583_06090 [Candidatus Parcubacteria bacterium]|nr:MAG: hypothetical protein C0583_06090 [Candidatus Parcubacteria bacterium]